MTVYSTQFREEYTGDGLCTSFSYNFRIFADSDLLVIKIHDNNHKKMILGKDYVVTGTGNSIGGMVILLDALPIGNHLIIERVLPIVQDINFRNKYGINFEDQENAFDRLTMILQRLAGYLGMHQDNICTDGTIDYIVDFYSRGNRSDVVSCPFTGQDIACKPSVENFLSNALNSHIKDDRIQSDSTIKMEAGFEKNTSSILKTIARNAMAYNNAHTLSGVNVLDFMTLEDQLATVGQHGINNTNAIVSANAKSKVLIFSAGHTFNLENWEPLPGTIIIATGATIQRHSNVEYRDTGSSGAIIITNNDIEVIGGVWQDHPDIGSPSWSAPFIINGGDNFLLHGGFIIQNSWGGVSGHLSQNGSLVSRNFRIQNGIFRHNAHNTYLADIEGLIFVGNISEYSQRDGFKTYRNVSSIMACLNLIRFNGDTTVTQDTTAGSLPSMDGMDFFIAGAYCIVAMNFLHDNRSKGLDIKRNSSGSSESLQNRHFIIAMNFIFSNGNCGLEVEEKNNIGKIANLTIINNHIYNNGTYGIKLGSASLSELIGNHVYANKDFGIRLDLAADVLIANNVVYENNIVGISVVSGNNVFCTQNRVIGDALLQSQHGISWAESASGRCWDNMVSGHIFDFIALGKNPLVRGKFIANNISNITNEQMICLVPKSCIVAFDFVADAAGSIDISISRRNSITGMHDGVTTEYIATTGTAGAVKVPTAYVRVPLGISGKNTMRQMENNILLLTLGRTSQLLFTTAICHIHYID